MMKVDRKDIFLAMILFFWTGLVGCRGGAGTRMRMNPSPPEAVYTLPEPSSPLTGGDIGFFCSMEMIIG
jgi:hypothetical protein